MNEKSGEQRGRGRGSLSDFQFRNIMLASQARALKIVLEAELAVLSWVFLIFNVLLKLREKN